MLTNNFYITIASAIKGGIHQQLYLAIGSGESGWDTSLPPYQRDSTHLVNEMARKTVDIENIQFLDEQGEPTDVATTSLQIYTSFLAGEGTGTVRECGLFAQQVSDTEEDGSLLSYFVHERIEKTADMELRRSIKLDLKPGVLSPGQQVTRYLGNSNSRELHDLENETGACQINQIRFDHRIYFGSTEQATGSDYDYCAFCFGRELSQR